MPVSDKKLLSPFMWEMELIMFLCTRNIYAKKHDPKPCSTRPLDQGSTQLVNRRVADTASHDLNAKPEKRKVLAFASPALTKKRNEKLQTCRYVDERIWKLEKTERMAEARRGMEFPWTIYSFFCSFFQFNMAPKNDSICWLNSHGLRQFRCRLLERFKQMNFATQRWRS